MVQTEIQAGVIGEECSETSHSIYFEGSAERRAQGSPQDLKIQIQNLRTDYSIAIQPIGVSETRKNRKFLETNID